MNTCIRFRSGVITYGVELRVKYAVSMILAVAMLLQFSPSASAQCGSDMDCKGDRICENGVCVSPSAAPQEPSSESGCTNSSQCEAGQECVNGECIESTVSEEPSPTTAAPNTGVSNVTMPLQGSGSCSKGLVKYRNDCEDPENPPGGRAMFIISMATQGLSLVLLISGGAQDDLTVRGIGIGMQQVSFAMMPFGIIKLIQRRKWNRFVKKNRINTRH